MPATLSFNGVSFDPETGELGGAIARPHRLSRCGMAILEKLIRAKGRIVTRESLVDAMWRGRDDGPMDKQVDVIIHRLRRDLTEIRAPLFIMNEWAIGFRLAVNCPVCGQKLEAPKNFARADHSLLTEAHGTVTGGGGQ